MPTRSRSPRSCPRTSKPSRPSVTRFRGRRDQEEGRRHHHHRQPPAGRLRQLEAAMSTARRELHLNAFLMEAGHHEAAWRLPESNPRADFELQHWIALAQFAEDAKFDSFFLADGPALTGSGEFRPPGQLEPLTLLTALAQHTSRIGLIATVSSTYNEPYNLARRLASVDHVSGGPGRLEHRHLGERRTRPRTSASTTGRPSTRYAARRRVPGRRQGAVGQLGDDAVLGDKASGRYADPSRLHADRPRRASTSRCGPAERAAPAAGPPAAGAGGLLGGRKGLRRPSRGGHLHRPPDLRARRRLLRRHQGADESCGP